ncbi:hypothetical protein ACS0TY_007007 [Phlomoides rotata]
MIGSLPRLEVLKLSWDAAVGYEWNPVERGVPRLKFLQIKACNYLTDWNAESCHFPVLEKLVLEHLHALSEIPSGIGEIPTLRFIRLVNCCVPAAVSAMTILVEQESLGNEGLQLEVEFWEEEGYYVFKEVVKQSSSPT